VRGYRAIARYEGRPQSIATAQVPAGGTADWEAALAALIADPEAALPG